MTDEADDAAQRGHYAVAYWRCPRCLVEGQTRLDHENETNLAAHTRVVHSDADREQP